MKICTSAAINAQIAEFFGEFKPQRRHRCNQEKHWLWRPIDADGDVLDILVQPRRNAKAAKRFLKKLIDQFGTPRVIVTDKLRSYTKPIKALAKNADHWAHKVLNNAMEASHRRTRK